MATEAERLPQSVELPSILDDDSADPALTALATLSLLNLRLSRLEFLLTGTTSSRDTDHGLASLQTAARDNQQSIPSQLHTLETRLTALKRLDGLPGSLVRMIDTLRREYPDIFSPSSSSYTSENTNTSTKDLSRRADEVLSHATLYTSTSSRLQTLQTLRIPPATHSANLIEQKSRVKALTERQEKINAEVESLTERSTTLVDRWRDTEVDGMNELWDDWQERVKICERTIKREERRRKEESK